MEVLNPALITASCNSLMLCVRRGVFTVRFGHTADEGLTE